MAEDSSVNHAELVLRSIQYSANYFNLYMPRITSATLFLHEAISQPPIANLFMEHLETIYILMFVFNTFLENIFLWKLLMTFFIFVNKDSISEFNLWMNSLHDTIRFQFKNDRQSIVSLATIVFRDTSDYLAVKKTFL